MASNFISYTKHGVAESTLLKAKEVSESGDNADDTKEYEFKSRFGIKTMTNTRFGTWTIGA